ncbi:hypothetical protein DIPPA_70114 [Diplonema papillatum]|nr:hypothetical protein DIPPA_70114 [Diplonema papillatum]
MQAITITAADGEIYSFTKDLPDKALWLHEKKVGNVAYEPGMACLRVNMLDGGNEVRIPLRERGEKAYTLLKMVVEACYTTATPTTITFPQTSTTAFGPPTPSLLAAEVHNDPVRAELPTNESVFSTHHDSHRTFSFSPAPAKLDLSAESPVSQRVSPKLQPASSSPRSQTYASHHITPANTQKWTSPTRMRSQTSTAQQIAPTNTQKCTSPTRMQPGHMPPHDRETASSTFLRLANLFRHQPSWAMPSVRVEHVPHSENNDVFQSRKPASPAPNTTSTSDLKNRINTATLTPQGREPPFPGYSFHPTDPVFSAPFKQISCQPRSVSPTRTVSVATCDDYNGIFLKSGDLRSTSPIRDSPSRTTRREYSKDRDLSPQKPLLVSASETPIFTAKTAQRRLPRSTPPVHRLPPAASAAYPAVQHSTSVEAKAHVSPTGSNIFTGGALGSPLHQSRSSSPLRTAAICPQSLLDVPSASCPQYTDSHVSPRDRKAPEATPPLDPLAAVYAVLAWQSRNTSPGRLRNQVVPCLPEMELDDTNLVFADNTKSTDRSPTREHRQVVHNQSQLRNASPIRQSRFPETQVVSHAVTTPDLPEFQMGSARKRESECNGAFSAGTGEFDNDCTVEAAVAYAAALSDEARVETERAVAATMIAQQTSISAAMVGSAAEMSQRYLDSSLHHLLAASKSPPPPSTCLLREAEPLQMLADHPMHALPACGPYPCEPECANPSFQPRENILRFTQSGGTQQVHPAEYHFEAARRSQFLENIRTWNLQTPELLSETYAYPLDFMPPSRSGSQPVPIASSHVPNVSARTNYLHGSSEHRAHGSILSFVAASGCKRESPVRRDCSLGAVGRDMHCRSRLDAQAPLPLSHSNRLSSKDDRGSFPALTSCAAEGCDRSSSPQRLTTRRSNSAHHQKKYESNAALARSYLDNHNRNRGRRAHSAEAGRRGLLPQSKGFSPSLPNRSCGPKEQRNVAIADTRTATEHSGTDAYADFVSYYNLDGASESNDKLCRAPSEEARSLTPLRLSHKSVFVSEQRRAPETRNTRCSFQKRDRSPFRDASNLTNAPQGRKIHSELKTFAASTAQSKACRGEAWKPRDGMLLSTEAFQAAAHYETSSPSRSNSTRSLSPQRQPSTRLQRNVKRPLLSPPVKKPDGNPFALPIKTIRRRSCRWKDHNSEEIVEPVLENKQRTVRAKAMAKAVARLLPPADIEATVRELRREAREN